MGEGLEDKRIKDLKNTINNSFRVRPNQSPIYVEVGGYLDRILSKQNQIIFGRRGSGKSCLVVKGMEEFKNNKDIAIYINADDVKNLEYPDLLIRLLLEIIEKVQRTIPFWKRFSKGLTLLKSYKKELRKLLDAASKSEVTEGSKKHTKEKIKVDSSNEQFGLGLKASKSSAETLERKTQFTEQKLSTLERHKRDYALALESALAALKKTQLSYL